MTHHTQRNYYCLPVTFHQTFLPERQHLSALLRFAASEKEGTDQVISVETGIPTGQSSGKVPAMLDYCSGMGLLTVKKGSQTGQKRPLLTDFGRTVLLEDPNLTEELSQWIAHLFLCRRHGGAEIWHLSFAVSSDVLGRDFSEEILEEYLSGLLGKRKRALIGPLIRMYEYQTSFHKAQAIVRDASILRRVSAPLLTGFRNGYSGFLLSLWDVHFPEERQVTLTDFEEETYFQRMCGWNERQYHTILEFLQDSGAIDVDKQMRPWVLTRRAESTSFWRKLYDELA